MVNLRSAFSVLVIFFVMTTYASGSFAAERVYRDKYGRKTGSATSDKRGNTTYRDQYGRKTGSASTDRRGNTTYRDKYGRKTGSSSRR
jgi:hypothetical protein